ncbi:N-acetylmuramoyl-L-alanine amidase [Fluviicola chungangensis]|uniref:N-acetylmuramoyl-L-alanine amidase n=2 Tax=Fluviicola chungangensis TaxID=2597671 RepID=A0A556N631_9FLAO|nr:N-acetylmuramoyl-L-alanine amidase [Fluviicola chungangensis]
MNRLENSLKWMRWIAFAVPFVMLFGFQGKERVIHSKPLGTIKTIVIDAGHGGKDPGCHGSSAHEKNVCLAMALELGRKIKEGYPEIKVVFTRDKDVFVELDDRAKIANRANADLFICIHANSASATAYGTETYVLGLHKTDAQAKIADRENSTIYLEADKGEKYKDFDMSPDAIIARQLQLSVFLDQSILFADKLQDEFKTIGRYNRGVKQAGFLVLYKTTMPSVLIETGFLTNRDEEKFLADSEGQSKMAGAMFTAFEKYKAELEGVDYKTRGAQEIADNSVVEKKDFKDQVVFRVQIETSETKIAANSSRFKKHEVFEYQQDKLYKYTVGEFVDDFNAANTYKNELRQKEFPNAFVVAFQNGERISLEKAIKLAEK